MHRTDVEPRASNKRHTEVTDERSRAGKEPEVPVPSKAGKQEYYILQLIVIFNLVLRIVKL